MELKPQHQATEVLTLLLVRGEYDVTGLPRTSYGPVPSESSGSYPFLRERASFPSDRPVTLRESRTGDHQCRVNVPKTVVIVLFNLSGVILET